MKKTLSNFLVFSILISVITFPSILMGNKCTSYAEIGKKVPDFSVETYNPKEGDFGRFNLYETLNDDKWVVVFFYPADFTFVCPTELHELGKSYELLQKKGVEVLSISTDTKYSHLAWHSTESLLSDVKFQMAADHNAKVSRMFNVYDPETGMSLRGTFIISPKGVLYSSEVLGYNIGRDIKDLVRKVNASIYVENHPGSLCPSGWEEGDKVITPDKKD